jgi:tetraacyldisaccharide-1-P 4'-kinase
MSGISLWAEAEIADGDVSCPVFIQTLQNRSLSRGYGRLTKGYEVTNYDSNYKIVGDEAMQLFERFKNRFVIAVSEERVPGAKK